MQLALLLLFGFSISVSDFFRHIIPNRTLIGFASSICVLLFVRQTFVLHLAFSVKVLLCLAIFQWITAGVMGMGDVKYLIVLALLVGIAPVYLRGLLFSALLAGFSSIVYFMVGRNLNIDIPLAPAFTLGFTIALVL